MCSPREALAAVLWLREIGAGASGCPSTIMNRPVWNLGCGCLMLPISLIFLLDAVELARYVQDLAPGDHGEDVMRIRLLMVVAVSAAISGLSAWIAIPFMRGEFSPSSPASLSSGQQESSDPGPSESTAEELGDGTDLE